MIDFLGFIIFSFEANYQNLGSQSNSDTYSVIDSVYINLHYLLPGSKKMHVIDNSLWQ